MKKLLYLIKSPCAKCPYKLGLVKFVRNPCPHCMLNNYSTYNMLVTGKYKPDVVIMRDFHHKKSE